MNIWSNRRILQLMISVTLCVTFLVVSAEDATTQPESADVELGLLVSKEIQDGESVRRVQELLVVLGFDAGPADGILGSKTRNALLQWKDKSGAVIAATWLTPPRVERSSGWMCVSPAEVDAHAGPTLCRGRVRNMTIQVIDRANREALYYLRSGRLIPSPTRECPSECEIYVE